MDVRKTVIVVGALLAANVLVTLYLYRQTSHEPQFRAVPGKDAQRTPGGVSYEDVTEGSGAGISGQPVVAIGYVVRTGEGTVRGAEQRFSYRYGTGQAIRGLDEGIATMREGGRRILWIPPQAAYPAGAPGVPPDATLIVDVTLLSTQAGEVEGP